MIIQIPSFSFTLVLTPRASSALTQMEVLPSTCSSMFQVGHSDKEEQFKMQSTKSPKYNTEIQESRIVE